MKLEFGDSAVYKIKKILRVLITVFLGGLLGALILLLVSGGKIHISSTPSLPYNIFITLPDEEIKKGDIITFIYPYKSIYRYTQNESKLTKYYSCREGDILTVISKEYFCNDEHIGKAQMFDSQGVELDSFEFSGIVPGGKVFVTGTHEKSFDSRYYGFIDEKHILGKSYAIY